MTATGPLRIALALAAAGLALAAPGVLKAADPAAGSILVVIDPGHGGADAGIAAGAPQAEKAAVLAAALALQRVLQERGLRAVLTRNRDAALTLRDRQELANRQTTAVYLSLHAAATGSEPAGGLRVFVTRFIRDEELAELAAGEAGAAVRAIPADLAQNAEIRRSQDLARCLAEAWRSAGGQAGLTTEAPLAGVEAVHAPAALAELPWGGRGRGPGLADEAGRRRAATALADGLDAFLGRR